MAKPLDGSRGRSLGLGAALGVMVCNLGWGPRALAQDVPAPGQCVQNGAHSYCPLDGDTLLQFREETEDLPATVSAWSVDGSDVQYSVSFDEPLDEWALGVSGLQPLDQLPLGPGLELKVDGLTVDEEEIRVAYAQVGRTPDGLLYLSTDLSALAPASTLATYFFMGEQVGEAVLDGAVTWIQGTGPVLTHFRVSAEGVSYHWKGGEAFTLSDGVQVDSIHLTVQQPQRSAGLFKTGGIRLEPGWGTINPVDFSQPQDLLMLCLRPANRLGVLGASMNGDVVNGMATANWQTRDNLLYVTGTFSGTAAFSPYWRSSQGNSVDGFVGRFNNCHQFAWVRAISGFSNTEAGMQVAVDSAGSVYVVGSFSGTATFEGGGSPPVLLQSAGGTDVFVAKYNFNGNLLWAVRAGGSDNDEGLAVALYLESYDPARGQLRYVLIGGSVRSSVATFGPLSGPNLTLGGALGGRDGFVAVLDPNGRFILADRTGGPGDDQVNGVAVTIDGLACVAGDLTGASAQTLPSDGFLHIRDLRGSSLLTFLSKTPLRGPGAETAKAVAARWNGFTVPHPNGREKPWDPQSWGDHNHGCVVVGEFDRSIDLPSSNYSQTLFSAGRRDVYIASYVLNSRNTSLRLEMGGSFGGPYDDLVWDVEVANRTGGHIHVAGSFDYCSEFAVNIGGGCTTYAMGMRDGYVARYQDFHLNQWPDLLLRFGSTANTLDDEVRAVAARSNSLKRLAVGGRSSGRLRMQPQPSSTSSVLGLGGQDGFFYLDIW